MAVGLLPSSDSLKPQPSHLITLATFLCLGMKEPKQFGKQKACNVNNLWKIWKYGALLITSNRTSQDLPISLRLVFFTANVLRKFHLPSDETQSFTTTKLHGADDMLKKLVWRRSCVVGLNFLFSTIGHEEMQNTIPFLQVLIFSYFTWIREVTVWYFYFANYMSRKSYRFPSREIFIVFFILIIIVGQNPCAPTCPWLPVTFIILSIFWSIFYLSCLPSTVFQACPSSAAFISCYSRMRYV